MRIECGPCSLRPVRSGDELTLARYGNNRSIWLNLRDQFPHPYTEADAKRWIALTSSADEPHTQFAIDVDGQAVGGLGFTLHGDVERVSAEIGYWLGEPFWGRGIMSAAVREATGYGFSTFPVTRIYALPYAYNAASIRVLEKSGYFLEGVLRRCVIKDGVVHDQALLAITDLDHRR